MTDATQRKRLGRILEEERLRQGKTKTVIAQLAGHTAAALGHVERGKHNLSFEFFVKICFALSLHPHVVLENLLATKAKPARLYARRDLGRHQKEKRKLQAMYVLARDKLIAERNENHGLREASKKAIAALKVVR